MTHMTQFARRMTVPGEPCMPSSWLNVEIKASQLRSILNPSAEDYSAGAILRDTFGEGAKQRLARRKLDGVGEVHSACGVANSPDRIRRLQVAFLWGFQIQNHVSLYSLLLSTRQPW